MKYPANADRHTAHDIALLVLERHNGLTAGSLNYNSWLRLSTSVPPANVRATGYSGDQNGKMMTAVGEYIGTTSCGNFFEHKADITPGNSGGPITSGEDETDMLVYGVQAQQSHTDIGATPCGDRRQGRLCFNNAGKVTSSIMGWASV